MIRRGVALCVLVGGLLLIVRGWNSSVEHTAVRRTANAFLFAVRDGDAMAAFHLIDAGDRPIPWEKVAGFDWPALPNATVAITKLEILEPDHASVESRVVCEGFSIEPSLRLRRREDGEWRISRIQNVDLDYRWIDELNDRTADDIEESAVERGWIPHDDCKDCPKIPLPTKERRIREQIAADIEAELNRPAGETDTETR